MKVSLDGGVTYRNAVEGVRVIYEDQELAGDKIGELHLNMTDEGVITDCVIDGEIVDTQSETLAEIWNCRSSEKDSGET